MSVAMMMSMLFLGMAQQAAITAALFPNGTKPGQQLYAAILLGILGILFAGIHFALTRRSNRL
jgi:hypothetical protein